MTQEQWKELANIHVRLQVAYISLDKQRQMDELRQAIDKLADWLNENELEGPIPRR